MFLFCFLFFFDMDKHKRKTTSIDVDSIDEIFFTGLGKRIQEIVKEPDYILTNKKHNFTGWFRACTLNIPSRPFHVYMNKNITDENNHFLFLENYIYDDKIFKFYTDKGFSLITNKDAEFRYILTDQIPDDQNYLPLPINYSYLTHFVSVPVYQQINDTDQNYICFKIDINPLYKISTFLCFVFIFILLVFFYFYNLPINMKREPDDIFWFMSTSKINLTKPAKLTFRQQQKLSKLIAKVESTHKDQHAIIGIVRNDKVVILKRLDVFPMQGTYFVIYWNEAFPEIAEPMVYKLKDAEVHSDDSLNVQNVPVTLRFHKGYPVVDMPIVVSGKIAHLQIESNVKDDLPFGLYSLHYSYIDCMLLSLLNQMSALTPLPDAFRQFIKHIFIRLDLTSLTIITVSGSRMEKILDFSKTDDIHSLSDSIIRKLPNDSNTGNITSTITYKLISEYKFTILKCNVADTVYFVLSSQFSNAMTLKGPEQTFNFIMTMLVSYYHSTISTKGHARALTRIDNLIERTEMFTFIQCVGEPSNFLVSIGKLFNRSIDQKSIQYFLDNISPELRDQLTQEKNRKELNQKQIIFSLPTGEEVCILLSSVSYFDETINKVVYLYLAEDITTFNNKSKQLQSVHNSVKIASEFLGIHKVEADLTIGAWSTSLSRELGYTTMVTSLRSILYKDDQDIDFSKAFENSPTIHIRIVSALGYPVPYTMLRMSPDGGYFIYASKYSRELKAIAKCDKHKGTESFNEDFILIIAGGNDAQYIDSKGKSVQKMSLDDAIDQTLSRAQPDAKDTILETINKVRERKVNHSSCLAKLATELRGYCWYKFVVSYEFDNLILFVRNVHTKKMNVLMMQEMNERADQYLASTQMFYWTFEDSYDDSHVYKDKDLVPGSNIIINWKTLEQNSTSEAVDLFKKALRDHLKIDSSITLSFGSPKKYLMRGNYKDGVLSGVCTELDWMDQAIKSATSSIEEEEEAIKDLSVNNLNNAKWKMTFLLDVLAFLPDSNESPASDYVNSIIHNLLLNMREMLPKFA